MPRHPAFSIVINTDNRARSLAKTLESLRHLDYPDFEVCVVRGPTPDPTSEVLEPWHGKIKLAQCSVRNLAVSRNIGIAMSAGEIVAFIDDDAVPEPEWLRDLAATYETSDIDAAGGFVHDHTGVSFQWRYGTSNRLGESKLDWSHATPELLTQGRVVRVISTIRVVSEEGQGAENLSTQPYRHGTAAHGREPSILGRFLLCPMENRDPVGL